MPASNKIALLIDGANLYATADKTGKTQDQWFASDTFAEKAPMIGGFPKLDTYRFSKFTLG
jgi:hypothetical protein